MLGQRANGNQVNTRLGDRDQRSVCDIARCLELSSTICVRDGCAERLEGKIIEHDAIGAGCQCLIELRCVFDFDLDGFIGRDLSRSGHGLENASRGRDMIFFDQKGIE